jgi:hypothetical protein
MVCQVVWRKTYIRNRAAICVTARFILQNYLTDVTHRTAETAEWADAKGDPKKISARSAVKRILPV